MNLISARFCERFFLPSPPRLYTLHSTPYTSTILKIPFPCTLPNSPVLKTNEEPRTNQGTTKELLVTKKCYLLIFAFLTE